MQSLQRLCKSTQGASFQKAKQIYTAVVQLAITFRCQTQSTPQGIQGHKKGLTQLLEKIQAQALRYITGAYKSVPIAILQREANILPLSIYTQSIVMQAAKAHQDQLAYQYIQDQYRTKQQPRRQQARLGEEGELTSKCQLAQDSALGTNRSLSLQDRLQREQTR